MGLIYALVAAGLSLIFGLMDVVNFAHGELLMLAMYATYVVWLVTGLDPLLLLIPVALALFALGVAIYHLLMARALSVRFNRGMVQIFVTFGLAILLRGAAQFTFGSDFKSVSTSLLANRTIDLGGIFVPLPQLAAGIVSLLAFGALLADQPHRIRPRAGSDARGPRRRRADRHRPRPHLRAGLGTRRGGGRHRRRDARHLLLRLAQRRREFRADRLCHCGAWAASAACSARWSPDC